MKDGDRGTNYTLVEPILKWYDKNYIQRFQQTFRMQIFAGVRLFIGPKPIFPQWCFSPFPRNVKGYFSHTLFGFFVPLLHLFYILTSIPLYLTCFLLIP
jgi:hypothetical protein